MSKPIRKPIRINVRVADDLAAQIKARGEVSEACRTGLERYYAILAAGRKAVRKLLDDNELKLLADVCNGTLFEAWSLPMIAASVEDAEASYFEKWSCDQRRLANKLAKLPLAEAAALVDAIERFWLATGTGLPVDPARMLD